MQILCILECMVGYVTFFFFLHFTKRKIHIHSIINFPVLLCLKVVVFFSEIVSFNGPLDTVWHFQVPSFLCLRCQPLNGVINVPPKKAISTHSC